MRRGAAPALGAARCLTSRPSFPKPAWRDGGSRAMTLSIRTTTEHFDTRPHLAPHLALIGASAFRADRVQHAVSDCQKWNPVHPSREPYGQNLEVPCDTTCPGEERDAAYTVGSAPIALRWRVLRPCDGVAHRPLYTRHQPPCRPQLLQNPDIQSEEQWSSTPGQIRQ